MDAVINLSEDAVKRLILASAPERGNDFERLWKEYEPQIEFVDDRQGFTLSAAYGLILFDHKTMAKIWLLGFAAQKAYQAYSWFLLASQITSLPLIQEVFARDLSIQDLANESRRLICDIAELERLDNIDHYTWPESVPPTDGGKPDDVEGGAVFDMLCMAGGYSFLHELRHVYYRNRGLNLEPRDEEMACDEFAREFLYSEIDRYSTESGYDLNILKIKRALSLGIATVLPLVVSPTNCWLGTNTHPSTISRIRALCNYLDLPENNLFWIYMSSLLFSIMSAKDVVFHECQIDNQKNYLFHLLSCIEENV